MWTVWVLYGGENNDCKSQVSRREMEVIAHKIKNPKHSQLHWDFIEETCRSFNANLNETQSKKLPDPNSNIIALRHDKGILLDGLDFSEIDTILVGCDDSGNDDWMEEYQAVRIPTPNNYFLWSGVALGIVLYKFSQNNELY